MIQHNRSHSLRVHIREFVIPPIEDGLVLGRNSAVGHVAIGKALSLLSTVDFEHLQIEDDIISHVIVRSAILRKIDRQKLVHFLLHEIKPLMGIEEVLHLRLEVDVFIETSQV